MMNRCKNLTGLILSFILALTIYAAISGCSGGSDVGNPEIVTFASDESLTAYLVDQYAQSALPDTIDAEKTGSDMAAPPGVSDEAGYSQTNIQETGVDESDKAKTDGRYIYVAGDTGVTIIDANSDTATENSMKKISRVDVDGYVDSLYLYSDTLVILYTPENGSGSSWTGKNDTEPIDMGMPCWIPVNAKIGILIVSVSNPEKPLIDKNVQTDGFLVSSRLTGGRLFVISQYFPDIPPLERWYDGSEKDLSETYNKNKQKLDALTLDDFIPAYEEFDSAGFMTDKGRLVATEGFIRPENPSGGTIVSIITFDLADPVKDFESLGFISDVHHVYASTNALYLLSTEYTNVFNKDMQTDVPDQQTRISKFDLSSPSIVYAAGGEVPGRILNQFSLGEYDNVLRIATATGYVWDDSSENHVYCIAEEDDALKIIGRLEGLAPGERLYAARFIGDKGYLVTFVEIDPLFTLDLSDPGIPLVAGELKVPGYSTYIHPIGENHLLTIGKDVAIENSGVWYQGLQMSLFDISDFANPELIAVEKIGDRGTESEALFNHKALTFWTERNLIALPVSLYEHLSPSPAPWDYGTQTFHGLYVYKIKAEKNFEYSGRIKMTPEKDDFYFYPDWLRGIFIGQNIYAVNADTVKIANIESMNERLDSVDLQP